jgi:hypothetical protein
MTLICPRCSDRMVDIGKLYQFDSPIGLTTWCCPECNYICSKPTPHVSLDPPTDPLIEALAVSTDQSTVIRTSPSP